MDYNSGSLVSGSSSVSMQHNINWKCIMKYKHIYGLLLVLILSAMGCTKPFIVEGRVTFDDGTPLTAGTVVFDNHGTTGQGEIDANGYYVAKGVRHGKNRVYIIDAVEKRQQEESDMPNAVESDSQTVVIQLISEKFRSPDTSMLTCNVRNGGKVVYNIIVSKPSED